MKFTWKKSTWIYVKAFFTWNSREIHMKFTWGTFACVSYCYIKKTHQLIIYQLMQNNWLLILKYNKTFNICCLCYLLNTMWVGDLFCFKLLIYCRFHSVHVISRLAKFNDGRIIFINHRNPQRQVTIYVRILAKLRIEPADASI